LRVLVAIANYGAKNDRYLAELLAEYRSMSYQVDIVVLSDVAKESGPGVELAVGLPNKDPWSLPFAHKQLFADRLDGYDLFIYSEDDVLITEKNIQAFLRVNRNLREDEVPGFLRFEGSANGELNYPEAHGRFHWDPQTVRSRGEYTLAVFTNEHSACYMLSRAQLRAAIDSRGFLTGPHQGKHDLLCTAATDPYTQCGFQKLICISHLDEFLVHHLPNRYIGSRFGVGERELRRQVATLLQIGRSGQQATSLFQTETKLAGGRYSKDYYEPVRLDLISAIPSAARSVLSIGCGWGSTESQLAKMGLRVAAVPLDPVIPGGAEAGGIEIINGDLSSARRDLADRKFDCLLLSNVLHLVPNPVDALSSYASLLSDGGVAIAVAPNMAGLQATWKLLLGDGSFSARGGYEKTGVHRVSRRILESWFRSAGMKIVKIEEITHMDPERSTKVRRIASRLPASWMADEFVVVARRHSDSRFASQ